MQKTSSEKFIYYLSAVLIILFFLLSSVHFWSFNEGFYRLEHDTLTLYGKGIAEYIGISDDELADLTHFTLAYLNDPSASLDRQMKIKGEVREVFTDDEKLHMVDVQKLNLTANFLCIFSGIYAAVFLFIVIRKKRLQAFYASYRKILIGLAIFVACIGAWIVIDFDAFWNFFHHVFFPGNDLWLLDLRKDILIMIVPPEFFDHLVTTIVITFVILTALFTLFIRYLSGKEKA